MRFRYSAYKQFLEDHLMDDYHQFVTRMNERARTGMYDHEKPLFELTRRARQGDQDAMAMLDMQRRIWGGKLPEYTDEELGIEPESDPS